jgi:hypothetical protein
MAKYMIEFNPPADVKNSFEKNPDLQKKMGEAIERTKPLAAWFTLRYGFFVAEANSNEEITKKIAPFLYLFKTDVKISPAFSLDEFPKIVATLGEAVNDPQHSSLFGGLHVYAERRQILSDFVGEMLKCMVFDPHSSLDCIPDERICEVA